MGKSYNNYHRHSHYSSITTPDSNTKNEDYAKRIKELGYGSFFTTEHGFGGDIFEARDICDKYNLKCIFGMEGYIVTNPLEKDNSNYHIILIPTTTQARKKLNKANSRANKEGYYYKPRLFIEDLIKFDKNELYITTACLAGIISDERAVNDIFIPLFNHFGDNVFLEVQSHNNEKQKNLNMIALELSKKYNLKLIAANDSHYIYENEKKERQILLAGKKINYGDEDEFILDFPDYDTFYQRFIKQDVLNPQQIEEAINNTLIFDNCEEIIIPKNIKMPSLYRNLSKEERLDILGDLIVDKFKKVIKEDEITKEELPKYMEEIKREFKVIQDTKELDTADYFLFNDKLIDLAINKYGGVLTNTGRGCFTKSALIMTDKKFKTIDQIEIGDKVISSDGCFHKVLNKFEYEINENLVEFEHLKQGSSYNIFKNQCTLDHKILVNRNGFIYYIPAKKLIIGDLLCCPKIKNNVKDEIVIDLNNYNYNNFHFDDKFIYEKIPISFEYKYSPKWCHRNNIVNHVFLKKVSNGYRPKTNNIKGMINSEKILNNSPFKTLDNYQAYVNKNGFVNRKIPRFIKLNYLWNIFIGMMYGDGWTNKDSGLGFAINHTSKIGINKYVFEKIASVLNLPVYYNYAKDRNLIQLSFCSKIMNNFFKKEFFHSEKGKDKNFNPILFNQPLKNIKWLKIGLDRTDGSVNLKENKMCFDSTSLSLVNAYKIIDNMLGFPPMSLDVRKSHIDKRGFNNSQSYKIRRPINIKRQIIKNDENFWYLPITKINILQQSQVKVYDIEIEDIHNYTIGNIIVHNSAPSYYINRVLNLTEIDRLRTDIPLYPERFMSTARLLENHALPDIDNNIVSQEPFIKAAKELLGETGCYPMLAYGTMQEGEAFRNLCRAKNINFDDYNEVAKDLEKYKDTKEWKELYEESKRYLDTIVSCSVHPCAFLLLSEDIESEIGVMRIGDVLCATITSDEADQYKYLKDDFLIVTVVKLIDETFKLIGKPIIRLRELIKKLDNRVWELYEKGITCTLNQVDGDWATSLVKQYKPKTVAELSKFVACLRPSFNSWRDNFIARKPYTTGSKELDKVLESTDGYILYQESLMLYFDWLGITPAESIGLIKKISKKKIKQEDFDKLESRLKNNWIKNTGTEHMFKETWELIQSCISYGFNSSHSFSMALDSLYCAYLKVNYPLEYYTVALSEYQDDLERTNKLTNELSYFNIQLLNPKFGMSKGMYNFSRETNSIYKGVGSIKNLNSKKGDELYEISQNKKIKSFYDLLKFLQDDRDLKKEKKYTVGYSDLIQLIKLNYFSEFGKSKKLLTYVDLFDQFNGAKQIKKDGKDYLIPVSEIAQYCSKETEKQYSGFDYEKFLQDRWNKIENKDISLIETLKAEKEYLGYLQFTHPKCKDMYYVSEFKVYQSKNKPYLVLYHLLDGKNIKCRVKNGDKYSLETFEENGLIMLQELHEEYKYKWKEFDEEYIKKHNPKKNGKPIKGEMIKTDEKEWILGDWSVIKRGGEQDD